MIILEAIERAKRQREDRVKKGEPEPASSETSARRTRGAGNEAPPVARLVFEQVPIDAGVYEKNRVLMLRDQGHAYSAVLDAYRILRTRIWHRGVGSERWTSLGMVSAGPGEGKTLTSLNLALAFAREKKNNVFLLDLDLRNPSICRYLGVTPKVGIGSALIGEAKPEDVFFSIGVDNLVIAGGVTSYENSSEMLGGEGLGALLAYINRVDPHALILVDLPPLLISADSLVVAPKLSAVLLVVAEGVTRRDQLDRAIEVLSGSTVAGIVLNRSRESVKDYYG
jgi:Mrp family chromosome partitioning ATPase